MSYFLLRPAGRELAMLAVFLNLVSVAIEVSAAVRLLEALSPIETARYLDAFQPQQLDTLTRLAVRGVDPDEWPSRAIVTERIAT